MEERLAALEGHVRELQDQLEIRELLSRYGFTADLGHERAYSELWTEDGVYDLDDWKIEGREALHQMVLDPNGLHKRMIENRSMHVPTNLLVRVNGDDAWAECYSLVVVRGEDGVYVILTAGYNHFDFRRVDGRWHIRRRHRRSVGGADWGGNVITAFQQSGKQP